MEVQALVDLAREGTDRERRAMLREMLGPGPLVLDADLLFQLSRTEANRKPMFNSPAIIEFALYEERLTILQNLSYCDALCEALWEMLGERAARNPVLLENLARCYDNRTRMCTPVVIGAALEHHATRVLHWLAHEPFNRATLVDTPGVVDALLDADETEALCLLCQNKDLAERLFEHPDLVDALLGSCNLPVLAALCAGRNKRAIFAYPGVMEAAVAGLPREDALRLMLALLPVNAEAMAARPGLVTTLAAIAGREPLARRVLEEIWAVTGVS